MATNTVRIRAPFVRIFQWVLVGAFVVAYISAGDYLDIHTPAGYTVLTLIALRLLWGFIGSRHARWRIRLTSCRFFCNEYIQPLEIKP